MSPRVLLAWEGGAGRGHLVTLKVIAEALGDAAVCDAALCRMEHAAEIAPFCDGVFPGARLWANRARREAAGNPNTASWGEFLGDLNFWDPDFLIRQIGWWLDVLKVRQSRLVVGDFAPCAQLAAYCAGIPSVSVGTGYSVPSGCVGRFPVLLPEYNELVFDELELLEAVNTALRHFGAASLTRLSDIYAGATLMPRTIKGLDPYSGLRTSDLLPPLNEQMPKHAGQGDEVFIYFSTSEVENEALTAAVLALEMPRRAFLPGAGPEVYRRFSEAGVKVERQPVPIEEIARRSRMMIHAGQHGSICMGLGLGLPQVAAPQHLEQLFHARKAAELAPVALVTKRMKDAGEIRRLIETQYRDEAAQVQARMQAEALRPDLYGDTRKTVRDRLLPLLR